MRKYLKFNIFLVLLLYPLLLTAQVENFGFCQITHDWDKITVDSNSVPEGTDKIFIITNRPFRPDSRKGEFFPNDLAEFRTVSYLIATCNGSSWKLSFIPDFESGMKIIDDGRDILLFADGHGKTLPMVLSRAFQIRERYNVSLILFDWPSRNKDLNLSLVRVRYCSDNFFNLLLQIRDYRMEYMNNHQHFSILFHSLGNYFLSHLVVTGNTQYLQDEFIDNIIMNAPAVRSRNHGTVLSQLSFQKRIYVTWNKKDILLKGAGIITAQKMLGNTILDPSENVQYIDFTGVAHREHTNFAGYHNFEYDNPAVFYFYNTSFHGENVDLVDKQMFTPIQDNIFNLATN